MVLLERCESLVANRISARWDRPGSYSTLLLCCGVSLRHWYRDLSIGLLWAPSGLRICQLARRTSDGDSGFPRRRYTLHFVVPRDIKVEGEEADAPLLYVGTYTWNASIRKLCYATLLCIRIFLHIKVTAYWIYTDCEFWDRIFPSPDTAGVWRLSQL